MSKRKLNTDKDLLEALLRGDAVFFGDQDEDYVILHPDTNMLVDKDNFPVELKVDDTSKMYSVNIKKKETYYQIVYLSTTLNPLISEGLYKDIADFMRSVEAQVKGIPRSRVVGPLTSFGVIL